ncbi:MAG: ATP-dependent helicase [Nitrospiraceae bacterium]
MLLSEHVLDFAGLQREAYCLLCRDRSACTEVQQRFRHIVVDEHQDTNVLQNLIIGLVAAPEYNLCVVGDDDQSIYRFRGATVQNFLGFPTTYQDAGVHQVELGRNFRSTVPIVNATGRLIAHNPIRYEKRLVAHRGSGPEVLLVEAEDVDDEGQRLAELIGALRSSGTIAHWADVAVLLSSVKYYAHPLLHALQDLQIPHQVTGDGGFFDREDIQQLKNLIIVLGWPKYWRLDLFKGSVLALRPETITALEGYRGNIWALEEGELRDLGVIDGRDRAVLAGLIDLQRKIHRREHASILGLLHNLLALSGYVARLTLANDQEAQTALLNVAQFSRLAEAFDRYGRSRSTYRFGEYLRSLPERSLDVQQPPADDAVQIMTIHQAKGLEFPVVVVASVIEGRLPNRARGRRFLVAEELAHQVMPVEIAERRQEQDLNVHISDQRRLLYVGLTRARDLLIIGTSAKVRKQRCKGSRFLTEMGLAPCEPRPPSAPVTTVTTTVTSRPHLSFSAINAYLTCPLRYKLLYVDGMAVPTWHFAQYGTSLHRTLEAIHRSILRGESMDEAKALALFEEHWVPFGARVQDLEEKFKAAGRSCVAQYVQEQAASFPSVRQAELPFTYATGSCLLTGQVDLLREWPDGMTEVVDFKTRSSAGIALIRDDLQLGLYALACEDRLDLPISRLTLHLLADGRKEHFEWNPEVRAQVQATLQQVVRRLNAADFHATPGRHCRECEFRALCPYAEA